MFSSRVLSNPRLALVLPSENCRELCEISSEVAYELKDWAALAGLCCVATNGGLGPAEVPSMAAVLMNLSPEERGLLLWQLERWPINSKIWMALLLDETVPTSIPAPLPPATHLEASQCSFLSALEMLLVSAPSDLSCSLDGRLLTYPMRLPSGLQVDAASLALASKPREAASLDEELQKSCLQHIKRWARGLQN